MPFSPPGDRGAAGGSRHAIFSKARIGAGSGARRRGILNLAGVANRWVAYGFAIGGVLLAGIPAWAASQSRCPASRGKRYCEHEITRHVAAIEGDARRAADRAVVIVLLLLVGAVACIVLSPSLGGRFVQWDDDINILQNPHIRGLSLENLRWMFTDYAWTRRAISRWTGSVGDSRISCSAFRRWRFTWATCWSTWRASRCFIF